MSSTSLRALAGPIAFALAAACQSAPSHIVLGAHAEVQAHSDEVAAEVSDAVEAMLPRVLAEIPASTAPRTLTVRVERDLPALDGHGAIGVDAFTARRVDAGGMDAVVHLPERLASDAHTLAHELTHAVLTGPWRRLPPVLEEGLCEATAARLDPGFADSASPHHLALASIACECRLLLTHRGIDGQEPFAMAQLRHGGSWGYTELHALSREQWAEADWGDRRVAYAMGWLVAEAVGAHGLLALCRTATPEAPLAAEPVIRAAGLAAGSWPGFLAKRMTAPALRQLAATVPGVIAATLLAKEASRVDDVDAYLQRAQPRFSLLGGDASVPIASLPAVVDALRKQIDAAAQADGV